MPSLMTGRYEPTFYRDARHLDMWFLRRPPPEEQLVSQIFRDAGYVTAMFSASPWFSAESRLGRSFDSFAALSHEEGRDPRERGTNPRLFEWLEAHSDSPFFLYIHSLDTHEPRFASNTDPRWLVAGYPPERHAALSRRWTRADPPFDERDREQIRALYDGGIRVADAFVGEVVEAVRDLSLEDRTIFVISSDHGEMLAEDGESIGHPAVSALDELLWVPVIFAGPGVPVGRRLPGITQNVDIAPTLVELAGVETAAEFQGRSLVPFFDDPSAAPHTYAYTRVARAFGADDPNRVLSYPDRKYEVREARGLLAGQLNVKAFARPDRLGARRPLDESEPRLEAVRSEVREVLRPLRDRVREQPRELPPVFELGHYTARMDARVVRDRLDRRDGLWSYLVLPGAGRPEFVDLPFVKDRVLAGFPASEELADLVLRRELPNGQYRVSASTHAATALPEPVSFRIRVESEAEWRLVKVPGAGAGWVELGEYEVDDGRFDYELAAGERAHATVVGRLRFETLGAAAEEGVGPPSDSLRREELERLRSLGYVE